MVFANSIEYEIQYFQGEHSSEYLVSQMKNGKANGKCQLFKDGLLQQSWTQEVGKYIGGFTVYERGKAVLFQNWKNCFGAQEIRYIENTKGPLQLVIRDRSSMNTLYRGGFQQDRLLREGSGYEYDDDGCLLHYGVFHEDALFQLFQRFEDNEMVEYAVEEGVSNMPLKERHPVYRGGFVFDKTNNVYLRNGKGCVFDKKTGLMVGEGEWEQGVEKAMRSLHNGWYVEGVADESLLALLQETRKSSPPAQEVATEPTIVAPPDTEETPRSPLVDQTLHIQSDKTLISHIPSQIVELNVDNRTCNDASIRDLVLRDLPNLQSILIGDECFMYVGEVTVDKLPSLKSICVGTNSFTENRNSCGKKKKRFAVTNCSQLSTIQIAPFSFSDFSTCVLESGVHDTP